jgi:hypothetical protein
MLRPMRRLEAVTVITRSYLPHARVLADSLAEHEPRARLLVVVVDDLDASAAPETRFDTITPLELGLEARELHRRALLFDAQGLISSLRPLAVAHVLDRGAEAVLLIDADMLVLDPIRDLWRLARRDGVLLSPHVLRALEGEPGRWREEVYLRAGTFNGGLLGIGTRARSFVDWISARVARDCVRDPGRRLLYSQTWLDLVPALFPHRVLSDPGVNVTAHRLFGADLGGSPTRPTVDGAPLRLFHFAGFVPDAPDVLCRYMDGPDGRLDGRPMLSELCRAYGERLSSAGWPDGASYAWSRLPGGLPVDDVMRGVYRGALAAAERRLCPEPPDPFDSTDPERFVAWLQQPPEELSRYLLGLREQRSDLRQAFPAVPGAHTSRFLAWVKAQELPEFAATRELPEELSAVRPTNAAR